MPSRIRILFLACALAVLAACGAFLGPESRERASPDMMRGGDLYRTYCSACHTAQVHWREQRLVRSWDDLRYQVARWQRIEGQSWSHEEIDDVAAYLNRVFYEMPCPMPGCGGPKAGAATPGLVKLAPRLR